PPRPVPLLVRRLLDRQVLRLLLVGDEVFVRDRVREHNVVCVSRIPGQHYLTLVTAAAGAGDVFGRRVHRWASISRSARRATSAAFHAAKSCPSSHVSPIGGRRDVWHCATISRSACSAMSSAISGRA